MNLDGLEEEGEHVTVGIIVRNVAKLKIGLVMLFLGALQRLSAVFNEIHCRASLAAEIAFD